MLSNHEPSARILRVFKRLPVDSTPVWFMRQAGRYMEEYRRLRQRFSMLELCRTPELAAEITLQPLARFDLDAAIIFADILLPLAAMGVDFQFAKGEGPVLEKPLRQASDVDLLRVEGAEERPAFVYEAIRLSRSRLDPRVALIGFAGAPFTVASYMIEGGHSRHFASTKLFMYEQGEGWPRLMDRLCEVTIRYLTRQVEAGADLLQLFDSWVGCLGRADYATYVAPYMARIFSALSATGVPTIHFGTGTGSLLDLMRAAGGDALGVDWRVDLDDVWSRLGNDVALQGNLDPVALMGPVDYLRAQTERILRQASGHPHIFNLGHGILPETPPQNIECVIRQVRDWGNR